MHAPERNYSVKTLNLYAEVFKRCKEWYVKVGNVRGKPPRALHYIAPEK
jgi:hypothetical protein